MSTTKIISIVALIIVVGIGLFIFVLYATVKTKSTSLNNNEPFRSLVGKTVTLNKETVLFQDEMYGSENKEYPYVLLDSLHPQWDYFQDRKSVPQPEVKEIMKFPAGTTFKIENAVQYTNGVSGNSTPLIFGTITDQGKSYKTGYEWGKMSMSKYFDKVDKCWQFHEAPWQIKADTAFYALPKAKFW